MKLHDKLGEEDMQLIAITARLIWLRHNEVIFGGDFLAPSIKVRREKEQQKAFNAAGQAPRDQMFKPKAFGEMKWKPPARGSLIFNLHGKHNFKHF